jgi:hypothetical protein
MGDTQAGSRWYDNTRVIWGLFVIIGILVGYIITDQHQTLADHANRLNRLEAQTEVNHEILKQIKSDIQEIKIAIKKGP